MPREQRSIYDIQKLIEKDRFLAKLSVLSFVIFFGSFLLLISSWFVQYKFLISLVLVISPIFLLLIIPSITPSISSFERMRYHLDNTIRDVRNREMQASISFNKMMLNFEDLIKKFNGLPYSIPLRKRLLKIFDELKYRIYPILKEGRVGEFVKIENTLQDFADLMIRDDSSELDKYIEHIVQSFEKSDREVVLPYENPPYFSRLFNSFWGWVVSNFKDSVPFRIFVFFIGLFLFYLLVIRVTNLEFMQEMVVAILIVSAAAATGTK